MLLFRVSERYTWPTDEEMRVLRSKRYLLIYYYLADLAVKEATHRRTHWREKILGSKQDGPTEFAKIIQQNNIGGMLGRYRRPFRGLFVKTSPYVVRRRSSRKFVTGALESGHPEVLEGFELDTRALFTRLAKTRSKDPLYRLKLLLSVLDELAVLLKAEFGINLWNFIIVKLNQEKLQSAWRKGELTAGTRRAVRREDPKYSIQVKPLK